MTLKFQPKEGSVVICDFAGFREPEMVKCRPVVVISRHRQNNRLVTVIPLSTTEPFVMENHHHRMSCNPLPDKTDVTCWAKCDMVYTVSLDRLDRYKTKGANGREYHVPTVSGEDLLAIRQGVLAALRLVKQAVL